MLIHPAVKLLSKSQLGKLRYYYANLYDQDLTSVSEYGFRFKKFIPEHEEFAVVEDDRGIERASGLPGGAARGNDGSARRAMPETER